MLQNQVNSIKQAIDEDLRKGERIIFEGLVGSVVPNRLPEHLFADYFLPGFMGTNPNPRWLLEWIGIAGSPAAEVSIFDTTTGAELFRVPPVLSTRNILLPKTEGDLGDIFSRHGMMSNALGSTSTHYLFSALEHKSEQALANYQNDTNDRWRAIMARYGYGPNVPSNTPSVQNNPVEEDHFVY